MQVRWLNRRPRAPLIVAVLALAASISTGVALAAASSAKREPAAAPVNTAEPTIHGTLTEGSALLVDPGTWPSDAPPLTFTYQWMRCDSTGLISSCTFIGGATGDTYTATGDDVGHALRVFLAARDAQGQLGTAISAATTAAIADADGTPAAPPTSRRRGSRGTRYRAPSSPRTPGSGLRFRAFRPEPSPTSRSAATRAAAPAPRSPEPRDARTSSAPPTSRAPCASM